MALKSLQKILDTNFTHILANNGTGRIYDNHYFILLPTIAWPHYINIYPEPTTMVTTWERR